MNKNRQIYFLMMVLVTTLGCTNSVPDSFEKSSEELLIFPDYSSVEIPCNFAPLNFEIQNEGDKYITRVTSKNSKELIVKGKSIQFDMKFWKSLMNDNIGEDYKVEVFVKKDGKWLQYKPFTNKISPHKIDEYLSYRLIEPLFETWNEMGLYQRSLETFEEKVIFHNRLTNNGCMNCHSYQSNSTNRMMFHLRAGNGGTVIIEGDDVMKVDLKTDSTISAGVYPMWHPTERLIAFSVNKIGQMFHVSNAQKVSVDDYKSDIILYDIEENKVQHIMNTQDQMETFPCWSPDGNYLYFCSAKIKVIDADKFSDLTSQVKDVHYNLMRIKFNIKSKTFGELDTVYFAESEHKSVSFPRISPNGKYMMFTLSSEGNFSIWNKTADLYALDLSNDSIFALDNVNSENVESYHTWSSQGGWFVFSSRRIDGYYTRPYFSRMNEKGEVSKPILLPQKSPSFYSSFYKSYNVPELTYDSVQISIRKFEDIANQNAIPIQYDSREP